MKIANIFTTGFLIASIGLLSGCSDEADSATTANSGGSTNNGSLGDSTPTGRIAADGFFILYDPGTSEVFDSDLNYIQQSVVVTALADDVNDLVEVSGQTVNFRTEWGQWLDDRDSCVLENGSCSVTWRSADPATAPGSCRVAITAWTTGEEAFFDADDDGLFEASDNAVQSFSDLPEPFLDINSNGSFDGGATVVTVELVGELIDIIDFDGTTPGTKNGQHDVGNNLYDGSQCATGNALCNTSRTSMIIHTRSSLLIQTPFNEATAEDINGNGTFGESNINFCGTNPF